MTATTDTTAPPTAPVTDPGDGREYVPPPDLEMPALVTVGRPARAMLTDLAALALGPVGAWAGYGLTGGPGGLVGGGLLGAAVMVVTETRRRV